MIKPFKSTDWFSAGSSGQPYPHNMPQQISGVYGIRNKKTKKVLYIGESHSQRLRDTLGRHLRVWQGPTAGPTYMREDVELAWQPSDNPLADEAELINHYNPADNHLIPELDFSPDSYKDQPEEDLPPLPVFNDDVPF